jgi:DNA polymerase/3'-5' exonuclease PolX
VLQLTAPVYTPPDLNTHITGPLKEIRDIYKEALGDDRRYFSYYKALSVLEKVPFKITSVDQIKGLPTLGKSLLDTVKSALLCMTNKHGFLMYGKNKVGFGFLLFFEGCNHAYEK